MSSTSLSARQAIREPRSSLSQRISTRASSSCELLAALQPSYVLQSTSTNGDAMFLTFREQVEKLLTEALEKCEYPSGDLALVVKPCLLYTSDAADEEDSVDLGGRRIIKK